MIATAAFVSRCAARRPSCPELSSVPTELPDAGSRAMPVVVRNLVDPRVSTVAPIEVIGTTALVLSVLSVLAHLTAFCGLWYGVAATHQPKTDRQAAPIEAQDPRRATRRPRHGTARARQAARRVRCAIPETRASSSRRRRVTTLSTARVYSYSLLLDAARALRAQSTVRATCDAMATQRDSLRQLADSPASMEGASQISLTPSCMPCQSARCRGGARAPD